MRVTIEFDTNDLPFDIEPQALAVDVLDAVSDLVSNADPESLPPAGFVSPLYVNLGCDTVRVGTLHGEAA